MIDLLRTVEDLNNYLVRLSESLSPEETLVIMMKAIKDMGVLGVDETQETSQTSKNYSIMCRGITLLQLHIVLIEREFELRENRRYERPSNI